MFRRTVTGMADVEKVKQTLKYCADKPGWKCDRECLYSQNGERTAGTCWVNLNLDALSVIEELQTEIEQYKGKCQTCKSRLEGVKPF